MCTWKTTGLVILAGGLFLMAGARPAGGEQAELAREPPPPESGSRRVLAEHVYIGSQLVRDPFATTYVDNRTGIGVAEAEGPAFDASGAIAGEREYDLAAVGAALELQLATLRWLAVRAGGSGNVYSGTSGSSAIGIGVSAGYDGFLGVTVGGELHRRFRLAAIVDYTYGRRDYLNVLRGLARALSAREINGSLFIDSITAHTFVPGISAALTPFRALGLVGVVQFAHSTESGELVATGENQLTFGLAADLELGPLVRIPLGLLGAYKLTQPLGDDDADRAQAVDVGVFYTGRRALDLGLQAAFRHFPGRRQRTFDSRLAIFVIRYYWQ